MNVYIPVFMIHCILFLNYKTKKVEITTEVEIKNNRT